MPHEPADEVGQTQFVVVLTPHPAHGGLDSPERKVADSSVVESTELERQHVADAKPSTSAAQSDESFDQVWRHSALASLHRARGSRAGETAVLVARTNCTKVAAPSRRRRRF